MVNHALAIALVAITGCQSMAEFAPAADPERPDAGTPDASAPGGEVLACFGTQLLKICVNPSSLTGVAISAPLTINTDNVDMCTAIGKYCVIAATTLTVNAALRATGTKPLVLLASDSILVNQLIDVGSHRSPTEFIGAGADPVTCLAGALPGTSAGGAGGSFAGTGGSGGAGGGGGAGGLPASATTPIPALRGGCRGQDGDGPGKGVGGHGGGAVYLIAGNRISITGPGINAAGEGGTGGAIVIANMMSGGGGGGAGGMIGLDAPTITSTGLILANGGGGGQGSGTSFPGAPGSDPAGINAAGGGTAASGGSGCGGNGGNGSSGMVDGSGAGGGALQCPPTGGGGGGGGGAAGIIKAPATANLGAQLSPAATR